jgi:hypothetical protein
MGCLMLVWLTSLWNRVVAYLRDHAFSGWEVTILKWSTQLAGLQMVIIFVLGLVTTLWATAMVMKICLFICLILAAAIFISTNLPQKFIASYDKRKFRLVPIEEDDNADNP